MNELTKPFDVWHEAVSLDKRLRFGDSSVLFKEAARLFFDAVSSDSKIMKAHSEYSTLMDAFSLVELGRSNISMDMFDSAIKDFQRASQILRSTIHFGFLAPYVSACATVETADMMRRNDEDCLQGYKNAISLFEQSKMALGFRDEKHPVISLIDSDLKYCISKALFLESLDLEQNGQFREAIQKRKRAEEIRPRTSEGEILLGKRDLALDYFPLDDHTRVIQGAFVMAYPDLDTILLINLGCLPARLKSVGNFSSIDRVLGSGQFLSLDPVKTGKGKIRITYEDTVSHKEFNEGCLLII